MAKEPQPRYRWWISGRITFWSFIGLFAMFVLMLCATDGIGVIIVGGFGLVCWGYNLFAALFVSGTPIQRLTAITTILSTAVLVPVVITGLFLGREDVTSEDWAEFLIPYLPVMAVPISLFLRILKLRSAERWSRPL